ncbi:family 2 glycosyl transferase [Sodiomyces alkalinus F11]|uniref:Family 2 glycosyl transferase n=1 Tax=Sodiomyces alkalinus (strain CBS 110278 / VKM F-3762 / F11) TaxID=1314773 RepID=A0A3N2PU29_SODAK|nr:family 2 glycosyl transferase [Sodiomyces alkalinus F11]ROT38005.1 family 2 glycosyl transferase [Sodiomyces alkalinus F11]
MTRPISPNGRGPSSESGHYANPFGGNPFDTDEGSAAASLASNSTFTVNVIPDNQDNAAHGIRGPAPTVPPHHRLSRGDIERSPLANEITNEKVDYTSPSEIDSEHANHLHARRHSKIVDADTEKLRERHTSALGKSSGLPLHKRMYHAFRRTYCPIEPPELVLPVCPDDREKVMYVHTNRILLYIFGVISFLALGAGMWLFTLSSPVFYWYAAFAGAMCIYLFISYAVGVIGRDWDYQAHLGLIERHPITDETAPTVDIFLPVCKEPIEILNNTWRHIAKLDWPAHKLKVYVMDDGVLDEVRQLAESFGFIYSVRDDRPRLRKAGNLRWTFARTNGDFFCIFDADFCPRPDFIKELIVEHLDDPKTAIVQSPQFFRVLEEQTWVEQGAGATQELFYRVVQVNRNRWGASICVGSNAVYRRAALEEVGGTAEIGFSEDVHTGFGAVDRGWKVKYIPLCLATGVCPDSPRAFFSQQMRWARGSTTLLTNGHFWVSNLTFMQKVCYLSGFLYYSAVSLNIFLAPIAGTLLLAVRPEFFRYWNLAFAIPSILYGVILMRVWAKAKYGFNVQHATTVQSYAYLTAIKDRLFNIELLWAASGDTKAHKSNKYRNMRLLCIFWTIMVMGSMIGVVTWRLVTGFTWYHTLPLLIINVYNFYINHYFMFCNW